MLSSPCSPFRLALLPLLLLPLVHIGDAAPAKPPSKSAPKSTSAKKPPAKKPAAKKPPAKKPPARPLGGAVAPIPRPTPTTVPAPVPTPVPTPVAQAGPRTFALLVGVGKYASPAVSSLAFPAQDAQALGEAAYVGGLPREQVLILTDEKATRGAILEAVDTFFKPQVRAGDRMIVFLAGHGISKGVGLSARSWFLPHDVRGFTTAQLEESAVEMKALTDKLGELPASQFALFVDACREDPTPGRGVKNNDLTDAMARSIQVAPENRTVDSVTLFACSVGQRAYEDAALKHGVFTNAILESLKDPSLPRADGFVDAGVLADYVGRKVKKWSADLSRDQGIDIEQTPDLVAGVLNEGVRVIPIKQDGGSGGSPSASLPARLAVLSIPERATVFIEDQEVGLAPLTKDFAPNAMPAGGVVNVRVKVGESTSPNRVIKLMPGYLQQVPFDLVGARGLSATSGTGDAPDPTSTSGTSGAAEDPLLVKARRAEQRGQFEVAESAYGLMIEADPKNGPARERLAQLLSRRGKWPEAIGTLAQMNTALPGAHSLSLISRAYTALSMRLAWREASLAQKPAHNKVVVNPWTVPTTSWECANYAFVAASNALKAEPTSNEALVARGLALVAGGDAKDRDAAMKDLARPVLLDENNSDVHYALGLAIRTFGQNLPDAPRKAEMARARLSLARAIELRPDFYDARREMALCAALMGDRAAALRECEAALAYRGGASDEDEFAALEMAMSVWHKRAAEAEADPQKKAAHEQAGAGYMEDAQEDSKDKKMSTALQFLSVVGVGRGQFLGYLPPGVQQAAGILTNPVDAVKGKVTDKVNRATGGILGGIFH